MSVHPPITQEEIETSRKAVIASGVARYVVAMPTVEGKLVTAEFVTSQEAEWMCAINNSLPGGEGLYQVFEVI